MLLSAAKTTENIKNRPEFPLITEHDYILKIEQKLRKIYHGKKTALHIPIINGRYCFIQSPQIDNFPCTTYHVNLRTANVIH